MQIAHAPILGAAVESGYLLLLPPLPPPPSLLSKRVEFVVAAFAPVSWSVLERSSDLTRPRSPWCRQSFDDFFFSSDRASSSWSSQTRGRCLSRGCRPSFPLRFWRLLPLLSRGPSCQRPFSGSMLSLRYPPYGLRFPPRGEVRAARLFSGVRNKSDSWISSF